MKHHKKGKTLARSKNQKKALLRSLYISLIDKESIKTTEVKAKEIRPGLEKLITRSKNPSLSNIKILEGLLGNKKTVSKLVKVIGPKFKDRNGGYLRITKLPIRKSSAAKMALIEFV